MCSGHKISEERFGKDMEGNCYSCGATEERPVGGSMFEIGTSCLP